MGQGRPDANGRDTSVAPSTTVSSAESTVKPTRSQLSQSLKRSHQLLAILLAVLSGVCLVTQNGVNTNLKVHAIRASFPTACVSFSVGLAVIASIALVHKPHFGDTTLRSAPWYAWTGGIVGPVYVVSAIFLSSKLGFAAYQLCAIAGQLLSSLCIDVVGLLHMKKRRLTLRRVAALVGVFGGAVLTSSSSGGPSVGAFWLVIYSICATIAGSIFPVQAVVVSAMQAHVKTPFRAVTLSFLVGTLVLLLISIVSSMSDGGLDLDRGELWMWTGGVLGACLVTCNVVGTPIIGAASYVTTFLTSQLVTAFVYDGLGAFGFDPQPPTVQRSCGLALAISSAALFQLSPAGQFVAPRSIPESSPKSDLQLGHKGVSAEASDVEAAVPGEGKAVTL